MKVITLISGGDSGGAKTHVHSLLQNLSRTIEVTMVCFLEGPFAQEARELGIPTVVLSGRNLLRTYRTLKRMIREGGYQLIHCHGARGNMMGALLRRSTGLPVVTTVHSDYRLDYLGRPLSRLTYGTINTLALRRLDYRIGVSDAMTDLLIKRGFDPDRLFTIYNGIDFTPRTPALSREEYFRSVGLEADGDSVVVGIAARLNPVKDIATLVRGFAKAHQECPSLRLLIAGDGEQMSMLKGLAAELGVERQVCFAGWVSDTDSFYHAIDINTLTSLSETFPYSLTEGARAALPTIASRVGGVPYLIEHGVHGLLFEAGDADTLARHLITLAKDPTLRQHLGERLYQRGREDFSLESTLERQLNIYETILRRQSRKKGRRDGALVCGAYGRGNAGDDAILEAIVTELRQIDPDLPQPGRHPPHLPGQLHLHLCLPPLSVADAQDPPLHQRRRLPDAGCDQPPLPVVLPVYHLLGQAAGQPGDDVRLRHRPHSLPRQPPQGLPRAPEERGRHHPTGHTLRRGTGGHGGDEATGHPLRRSHGDPPRRTGPSGGRHSGESGDCPPRPLHRLRPAALAGV